MKRVLIIGSGGAGKSTLARRLHEITGLELFHLDKLYWQAGWLEPPKDEWKETIAKLLKGDSWILDGNFGGTLEMRVKASDTVIFLDFPPPVCLFQALKRITFYCNRTRPDMTEGCREKFDFKFFWWIWNFPKHTKPKIEKVLQSFENEKTIFRLKSRTDVEKFLRQIGQSK